MPISKIAPCLWFNGEAEEAAKPYVSLYLPLIASSIAEIRS
jgi:predicted 3-demethylubiquinone-9 3-methyltransferase (glyoxalase superfamily)